MPYGKTENLKDSNVNYNSRDFVDLKSSLIEYTKSYFPNTYKDFNETSPGMMLLEMNAYVGDVLNFYIDQQYKEMMLPLAEERRNVLMLSKAYGYKVKPIAPSYVDLDVTTTISALTDGSPNYSDNACVTIDKGMQVKSQQDENLLFETLDIVDFTMSSSLDEPPSVNAIDESTGIAASYILKRKVKAISGKTITTTFDISQPKKFKKINLPEKNVIEILTCIDSNGNNWYEVDSLAQDKIPLEKHYTSDGSRDTSYVQNSDSIRVPVPYSLEYIKTSKRFVTEINVDNTISMIFGNGILKNGNTFNSTFLAIEQVGINLPGGEQNLESSIDPLLGDAYGTLGEAPSNTTLTITYRIGGGSQSNVSSNNITTINITPTLLAGSNSNNLIVNNPSPAAGGTSGESLDEIKHRAMINTSTQNRCVTKEDYEARSLNMPVKFGSLAKVYCARSGAIRTAQRKKVASLVDRLKNVIDLNYDMFDPGTTPGEKMGLLNDIKMTLDADSSGGLNSDDFKILLETLDMTYSNVTDDDRLYTIDLYLLSYDNNKNLITSPNIIKQNLKKYLNQYRLLTDQVAFYDGYIINFGIVFDVISYGDVNKDELKLKCIEALKNYFNIDKMQFKQIIYVSDLENLLMDVDGVRAVNYVTVTQDKDYNSDSAGGGSEVDIFTPPLYTTSISSDDTTSTSTTNTGYGYYYDFSKFYGVGSVAGKGIVLPAYEPAVFELKNPNDNIKGIVR